VASAPALPSRSFLLDGEAIVTNDRSLPAAGQTQSFAKHSPTMLLAHFVGDARLA
jgi:hypothetical protein